VDEFSNFVNIFYRLLVLGRPERSSSSSVTQPALKREWQSKLPSCLKNVLQKPQKHFKGFSGGFTELHAKLDVGTLLDSAIYYRRNETRNRKNTLVCSQCSVTRQTDALG
jgi:hypothetical protein